MTDDHHDERYEDGDDSTGTVEDYVDWEKRVTIRHTFAEADDPLFSSDFVVISPIVSSTEQP